MAMPGVVRQVIEGDTGVCLLDFEMEAPVVMFLNISATKWA